MNKDIQRLLLWLGLAVAVIGGILAIIFTSDGPTPTPVGEPVNLEISADEWSLGSTDSEVVLVEFSDFQCPACASRESQIKDIIAEFNDEIHFVYRHFPLRRNHKNAQISAQAAEAAGMQDKFWEMHDVLFAKQTEWAEQSNGDAKDLFIGYAEELGLDTEKFAEDMDSNEAEEAVNDDYDSGIKVRVNSTPTFFLNGKQINPTSHEDFRALIRAAIQEKEQPSA